MSYNLLARALTLDKNIFPDLALLQTSFRNLVLAHAKIMSRLPITTEQISYA